MNNEDLGLFLKHHSIVSHNRAGIEWTWTRIRQLVMSLEDESMTDKRDEFHRNIIRDTLIELAALNFHLAEKI